VYTGSGDGIIYVYDVLTGKIVTQLKGHNGVIRDLSCHPNEPWIVSTSWDGTLNSWYYEEEEEENTTKKTKKRSSKTVTADD